MSKGNNEITDLSNKRQLTQLRAALDEAIANVARARGLEIKLGNCRYDADGSFCKFTSLEVAVPGTGGKDAKEWEVFQRFYPGFAGVPFGAKFTTSSGVYTIDGYSTRARKYPVLGRSVTDGTRRKFTIEGLERAFGVKRFGDSDVLDVQVGPPMR